MPTAKSLILAAGSAALYTTRYVTNRIHRKLDERDNLLRDAIYKLEKQSVSEWPSLLSVSGTFAAGGATGIVVSGKHLLNSASQSSGKLFSGEAHEITLTATLPGEQTITVTFTEAAGNNTTLANNQYAVVSSWTAGTSTLVIEVANNATAAQLVSAINDATHSKMKYFISASFTGSDDTVDLSTPLSSDVSVSVTGGEGDVLSVLVGSFSIVADGTKALGIHDWSYNSGTGATSFKVDLDGTTNTLSAGASANLSVLANGVTAKIPAIIA